MSRITAKGQVTIPKSVRSALGVSPGDEIEFRISEDRQVTVSKCVKPSAFTRFVGYLSRKQGRDPDRIIEELRGEAP